ncbi:Importin subunit beta-1 [Hibiscus syriacus]|uniref:Importin subunit beta-1 n=2 Tax=Hibiscus syriacus TaxID=106335 RepID=A0A6A3A4U2_HIBSY|nr:Importin subunit beta-1 [Hibiscus syriacus]
MEVTQVLLNAQSIDGSIRKNAEESLKQFQEQNLPCFLLSLSGELVNEEKPLETRKLAGLILKNALDAKEQHRKFELVQRWLLLDDNAKSQIKACLLKTISSPVSDARSTASQVIAKVAGIELPQKQWLELIGSLLSNVHLSPAHAKQATLETLGYLCEEVSPDVFDQDKVNKILTAVFQGMSASERNTDVRLVATRALNNALGFALANFNNDMERDYLMRVVYIFNVTAKTVREDDESVALQAIEFWSSICDEEIDILEEYGGVNGDSDITCFYFIKQALPALVPMLLELLLKQEEDQDQDEGAWNIAMAGGTCLGLVARTVGDDIVPLVVPFIEENIAKPDWRQREAATYAFGSILDGPSPEKLLPLVNVALNFMLSALTKDPNSPVKDTTAWTLGRIFEFLHGSVIGLPIITQENCQQIVIVLLQSMKDTPNVAEKACGALYFLTKGYEEVGPSSPLAPFFQEIVQSLLTVTHREDARESRLRTVAYETLNEVVRCSTDETAPLVLQLVPIIMMELHITLEGQKLSSDKREKQSEFHDHLCGCLQVIIQKLGSSEPTKHVFMQYADQIMGLFLRVFSCKSATVHEEAMLAIGALAYATGPDFAKYMPDFYRYLEVGLQNFEEYQVCAVTVGVVGDICRALEDKIAPYCDGIMTQLLKNLSSNQLRRSVKPPIFSCFGDIALAVGEYFEKYLMWVMSALQRAAELSTHVLGDDELTEYTNSLRNGILEAYSGIFQGFKSSPKTQLLIPYAPHILQFLDGIYMEKDMDDVVMKTAIEVLGDVADTLGSHAGSLIQQSLSCKDFLNECLSSEDLMIKESAEWAKLAITRATSV